MAGGGVGEAMLIGAAVGATAGGAGAAIQGGDPLKGALTGGAMGAVGGGLGAGFGAGAGAAEGAVGAGTSVTPTANAIAGSTAGTSAGIGGGTTTGSVFGGANQGIAGATNLGSSISGAGTAGGTGVTTGGGIGVGNYGAVNAGVGGMSSAGTTGSVAGTGGAGAGSASGLGVAQGSALPAGYGTSAPPPTTNIFGQTAGTPGYLSNTQLGMTAATTGLAGAMQAERDQFNQPDTSYSGPLSKLKYDPDKFTASSPTYAPASVYRPTYAAEGGIMQAFQSGGPVERMTQMNTAMNPQGGLYPQGMIDKTQYATPTQRPTSLEVVESEPSYDARINPITGTLMAKGGIARFDAGGLGSLAGVPSGGGQQAATTQTDNQGIAALGQGNKKRMLTQEQMDAIRLQGMSKGALNDIYGQMAAQGLASGGISSLGSYSDGGRMLKGPGDGMSDNIPATIAGKQPARLADGEFVVSADVVSHLGNGSTDAGAKRLYSMMDQVRKARTGRKAQGKQINANKFLPRA